FEDVQSVCNQLIVIDRGRILFTGTPEALIASAQGHGWVCWESDESRAVSHLQITSRVNISIGVACRGVAAELPPFAEPVEPSLEDAYLYWITGEGELQ